MNNSIGTVELW